MRAASSFLPAFPHDNARARRRASDGDQKGDGMSKAVCHSGAPWDGEATAAPCGRRVTLALAAGLNTSGPHWRRQGHPAAFDITKLPRNRALAPRSSNIIPRAFANSMRPVRPTICNGKR